MPLTKPYNAINGFELKKIIAARVENELRSDSRFSQHLTYPQVQFRVVVEITTDPTDAGSMSLDVRGIAGQKPPVGYAPPVASDPMTDVVTAQPIRRASAQEIIAAEEDLAPETAISHVPAPEPLAQPASRAAVKTPVQVEPDDEHTVRHAPIAAGSGEVITGGAQPLPENLFGVRDAHRAFHAASNPPAGETVVIDNPNQARRDAGLPVPEPTRTRDGNVVDFPNDTQTPPADTF